MDEEKLVGIMFREEAEFFRKVIMPEFQRAREELADFRSEVNDAMATKADLATVENRLSREISDLSRLGSLAKGQSLML